MGVFRLDPANRDHVHPDDVDRVDRRLLLSGPIALYYEPARLQRHIGALESYGYRCPAFDCRDWESEAAMHKALASGLNFPAYYGHNLNALNDCLSHLEIPEAGGMGLCSGTSISLPGDGPWLPGTFWT